MPSSWNASTCRGSKPGRTCSILVSVRAASTDPVTSTNPSTISPTTIMRPI